MNRLVHRTGSRLGQHVVTELQDIILTQNFWEGFNLIYKVKPFI